MHKLCRKYLIDFSSRLPHLGLNQENLSIVEESRAAYLFYQVNLQSECFYGSESESSGKETSTVLSDTDAISKEPHKIKDKSRKRAKEEIKVSGLLRKKISTSTKSIIKTFPDIGDVIEKFVESCDIGADKWRRTGLYAFSGDVKKTKRVTFKRIQEKLQEHYNRKFSYGTVVQLVVQEIKEDYQVKGTKG